ncbi:alkaline phosphatase [Galbibacter sp. PAP.153]|uniref:alkaline phosphatase n=1 Tax=Galbibacter sp. PAP.153 TaxID=3104623 RepID=UPI00300A9D66
MKNILKLTLAYFLLLSNGINFTLFAQETFKVHSHNDYEQQLPFWYAFSNGAASIEADIFLKNNELYVTHSEDEIDAKATLENMYLKKLESLAASGELRELQLLVDIKSDAYKTLDKLVEVLKRYPSVIDNKKVRFVISGNRPEPEDYNNYPDFIWFDHQNLNNLDKIDLKKVALVSVSFKTYTVWNGYGRMVAKEQEKVEGAIKKAHDVSRPFRFWATPDTKTAWANLAKLGVDYINTDEPALAKQYLSKLANNTYSQKEPIEIYKPVYGYNKDETPQNIILMIGDGNGLAQISAAMIANRGELTLTGIKDVGLAKTASFDNLITDSAAGATAMATGTKTNNRAIGVDPAGKALDNLVTMANQQGFNTAIVSTDAIYGATPASFYAHRAERDNTDGIVEDLVHSKLDFFMAGGKNEENTIGKQFKTVTIDSFTDFNQPIAVYLGDEKAPSMINGRENALPNSVHKALEVLGSKEEPFFLMVEGAQIDNGGHSNNIQGIIKEMLDFDRAIAQALRFADTHKNTLVVITADHETSGLGIVGGDIESGTVQADFLTVDHTGIMVPVFAYGPQAENFKGVFENTSIFKKIWKAINK